MSTRLSFSIVLQSRWGMHHLPRMFQSLAWQSADLSNLEIVFVDTGEEDTGNLARLWANMLHGTFRFLALPAKTRNHEAANLGMQAATGDLVLQPHPSARLHPYFLEDALTAFAARGNLDVLYSDFVDLGNSAAGLVQLPRFTNWRLKTRNVVGPMAIYRRKAFMRLDGYRPDTPFAAWDMAVQGALRGLIHQRLERPLFTCSLDREDADEALQGAAMVVVNNQGFFREDVVRWALASTRRSRWALSANPYRIPSTREVRQLFREHVELISNSKPSWLWRFTGPPPALPTPIPVLENERS